MSIKTTMKNIINIVIEAQPTNPKVQNIYYPVFAYVTFNVSEISPLFNHFHRYCLYNAYDLLNVIHSVEDTCSDEINQLIIKNGEETLLYLSNHQDSDNMIITWKSPEILNVPEYGN